MHLTPSEELILNGEQGYVLQKAMEILAALGDIYDADRLIPIKSTQIAGVSYKNIGEAGLEWISGLSGTVKVPSILNPAGLDRVRWRELSISEEFAAKQEEVIRAYESLGILPWCTCTPYEIQADLAMPGDADNSLLTSETFGSMRFHIHGSGGNFHMPCSDEGDE